MVSRSPRSSSAWPWSEAITRIGFVSDPHRCLAGLLAALVRLEAQPRLVGEEVRRQMESGGNLSSLAELVPAGMFVGTSLILHREGRFLYGLRPPRPEGKRLVAELTGIGGALEAHDGSIAAGALREAREEMGCAVCLLPAAETVVVRGPGHIERLVLAGPERPVALVYRRYRTPPHEPWHERNQGEGCLVVYAAELAGAPQPAMELPALIWFTPAQVVATAQRDISLSALLAEGAELLADAARPLPPGLWLRLTDSQEALVLALGDGALPFYEALSRRGDGRPPAPALSRL